MANVFIKLGMLWGFPGGPSATLTGLGSLSQIQGLDFSAKAQKDEVKDGTGNTSGVVYSDEVHNASLDFIMSNTATIDGSMPISSVPSPGALITLVDSLMVPMGKVWLLDDVNITRSNTKAAVAKLTLCRYIANSVPAA